MGGRHELTAIIYDKRGRTLSIGKNSYVKTHTIMASYGERTGNPHKQYLHAEVAAIIRCRDLTKAHKIAIFRYGKKGQPLLAAPCPACTLAIKEAGINYVEYTVGE